VAADQNSTIVVDTGVGPVTLTLPTLGAGDYGWKISVMKTYTSGGGLNPIFIAAASGSVISGGVGVVKARRNVPFTLFDVSWVQGNWIVGRTIKMPVGSAIPIFTTSLPIGYEWPNGQVLVAANYPEYVIWHGSAGTPDLRERILAASTLNGAYQALINPSISGINPTIVGSIGGVDGFIMPQNNLPNIGLDLSGGSGSGTASLTGSTTGSLGVSGSVNSAIVDVRAQVVPHPFTGSNITLMYAEGSGSTASGSLRDSSISGSATGTLSVSVGGSISVGLSGSTSTLSGGVGQTYHQNMPPTLICNWALVVE
jgi:hypothetical protein